MFVRPDGTGAIEDFYASSYECDFFARIWPIDRQVAASRGKAALARVFLFKGC